MLEAQQCFTASWESNYSNIWDRIFASQTQQLGPRVLVNVLCGFLQFVLGMGVFVEDIPMVAFFQVGDLCWLLTR